MMLMNRGYSGKNHLKMSVINMPNCEKIPSSGINTKKPETR